MNTAPKQTSNCAITARANVRRVVLGVGVALVLGLGFSAVGGYMFGDFASFNEPPSEKTYLVSMPDDEELLKSLSEQLTAIEGSEASTLNTIAPAAGSPLGTIGE